MDQFESQFKVDSNCSETEIICHKRENFRNQIRHRYLNNLLSNNRIRFKSHQPPQIQEYTMDEEPQTLLYRQPCIFHNNSENYKFRDIYTTIEILTYETFDSFVLKGKNKHNRKLRKQSHLSKKNFIKIHIIRTLSKRIANTVVQACPISQQLFNIYLDNFINDLQNKAGQMEFINFQLTPTMLYFGQSIKILIGTQGYLKKLVRIGILKLTNRNQPSCSFKNHYPIQKEYAYLGIELQNNGQLETIHRYGKVSYMINKKAKMERLEDANLQTDYYLAIIYKVNTQLQQGGNEKLQIQRQQKLILEHETQVNQINIIITKMYIYQVQSLPGIQLCFYKIHIKYVVNTTHTQIIKLSIPDKRSPKMNIDMFLDEVFFKRKSKIGKMDQQSIFAQLL